MPPERIDEVDRHVVRRPEAGPQRIRTRRGKSGHVLRVEPWRPQNDTVTFDVDAAPPGPAGQLGVLPRREVDVRFAVPFDERLEDDAAGRHVDAEGERLRREDDLDETFAEQLLDDLLEHRQHPGMVRGDAALQRVGELAETEHREVVVRDVDDTRVEDVADAPTLRGFGEAQPGPQALAHGRITTVAAEDEHDRGEQPRPVEGLDDLRAARHVDPTSRRSASATRWPLVEVDAREPRLLAGETVESRVHALLRVVDEQVVEPTTDEDLLPEGNWPVLLDDDGGVAANLLKPLAELLGVAHRR